MKINFEPVIDETIVFDRSDLPEGFAEKEGGMSTAFQVNRARFNDPLQTAVAMVGGINEAGELDMVRLRAFEVVREHLRNKDGEAVALIDTLRGESGKIGIISGYIGTLVSGATLFSDINGRVSTQIPSEYCGEFRAHSGSERGDNSAIWVDRTATIEGEIPTSGFEFKLGVPRGSKETIATQEVLAGGEIIPWVVENFGEGSDGYEVYKMLFNALTKRGELITESAKIFAVEPFISLVQREAEMKKKVREALQSYLDQAQDLERMREGNIGRTNIALRELEAEFSDMERQMYPQGSGKMTGPVHDHAYKPAKERIGILERSVIPLSALTQLAVQT